MKAIWGAIFHRWIAFLRYRGINFPCQTKVSKIEFSVRKFSGISKRPNKLSLFPEVNEWYNFLQWPAECFVFSTPVEIMKRYPPHTVPLIQVC